MELYAGIMGDSEHSPPIGLIKAAWCNNVGRYFSALQKTYGPCVSHHKETVHGESVITGWVFGDASGHRCTVRLFTPCPITDPDAVMFNGTRFPFKNFVLTPREGRRRWRFVPRQARLVIRQQAA